MNMVWVIYDRRPFGFVSPFTRFFKSRDEAERWLVANHDGAGFEVHSLNWKES